MSYATVLEHVVRNMERVIIDKREAIELTVMALLCDGHILIEDVPGVGKTSLASSLAKSLNCTFKRIQFTPDIMPSDITGFSMFNPKSGEFEFQEGAISTNVLLADEINRTSPKTQSSLLEAMEEKQVTIDGTTHALEKPFIVLATQNPIEQYGTYPLPEAQMDRFLMRISLGYPRKREEMEILARFREEDPLSQLSPVITKQEIVALQQIAKQIHVDIAVYEYIVDLTRYTRQHSSVSLGVSPRGSLALMRVAQAWAMYQGRGYVLPDDVVHVATAVLAHRISLTHEAKVGKVSTEDIVRDALDNVTIPTRGFQSRSHF